MTTESPVAGPTVGDPEFVGDLRQKAEEAAERARAIVRDAMERRQERNGLIEDAPTWREVLAAYAVPVLAVGGIITGIVVWRRRRARRAGE